jgi:hypothetical protein
MMRDRHLRVVPCRLAVHECGWAERRRSDEVGPDDPGCAGPREPIGGAEFHHEIVRVLPVDERNVAIRFAGLKELG